MKSKIPLLAILLGLISCKSESKLNTVEQVDLQRYLGKWYEIARLPNRFEKGLVCVTATYSLKENGKINVLNQGRDVKDKSIVKKANGTAWIPDEAEPGQLKVSFFWPFAGKYWIIALDKNYGYSLVGDPSREYLWILSRSKTLPDSIYKELTLKAKQCGFNTTELVRVEQSCDN